MTLHVVQYSGGSGSWAATERVIAEHGTANPVLLIADTRIEDPDPWRFVHDSTARIGVEPNRPSWQTDAPRSRCSTTSVSWFSHLADTCRNWCGTRSRSPLRVAPRTSGHRARWSVPCSAITRLVAAQCRHQRGDVLLNALTPTDAPDNVLILTAGGDWFRWLP
jgi:hypothetical protein